MKSHSGRKWIATIYLLVIPSVDLQIAMFPMFPPQMQVAVPMPMPMPFPVIIREAPDDVTTRKVTTTTTTTTERGLDRDRDRDRDRNRVPFPFPMHLQMPPRSYGVAVPVPPLIAPPPPVVVVPFPPRSPRWPKISREDADDCDSAEPESSSADCGPRRKRKKDIRHIKRKRGPYRRTFRSMEIVDNELVKPVLTYVSSDGDIKLKRRLTNDEAAELMNDKPFQKIDVFAGPDDNNKPRVLITSKNEKNKDETARNHRRRQVVMTTGTAQHILGEGRKELVFRPPGGKQISNLSVSFQISGDSE